MKHIKAKEGMEARRRGLGLGRYIYRNAWRRRRGEEKMCWLTYSHDLLLHHYYYYYYYYYHHQRTKYWNH